MFKLKYDLLIKNGNIIDVIDNSDFYRPWHKLDIGIKDDRIVKVGNLELLEAKETIDATNLVVSPAISRLIVPLLYITAI